MMHCAGRWNGSAVMVMSGLKVGIISALEREVAPMLKSWRREALAYQGRQYRMFRSRSGSAVYMECGIGRQWGMQATEALIATERPQAIVSAGFAGALRPERKVGQQVEPGMVIDGETGDRFLAVNGSSIALVSAPDIADKEAKKQLADRFAAEAVDMEAAAVARIARQHGVPFYAIKAISDEVDFPMPPFNRFVNDEGRLEMARFVAHISLRPQYWRSVILLGMNCRRAAAELCEGLGRLIVEISSGRKSVVNA